MGNPPFAGKNNLIAGSRDGFLEWLQSTHVESHGNADLVAHFYRRAFALLRVQGAMGLVATNTIAQGDTRATGLRWICKNGGEVFEARRRVPWPGLAAVIVSIVHVLKGSYETQRLLDRKPVTTVSAFLFHRGGHDNPALLKANDSKCFLGTNVVGEGFKFDDTARKGETWPLAAMSEVITKDLRNAERIFPFLGGEEINEHPRHEPHRQIVDFGDMSLDEAKKWPDFGEAA